MALAAAALARSPAGAFAALGLERVDEEKARPQQGPASPVASSPGSWGASLDLAWEADNHTAPAVHPFRERDRVRELVAPRRLASDTAALLARADTLEPREHGAVLSEASRLRAVGPSPPPADQHASGAGPRESSDRPVRPGGGPPVPPSTAARC